MIIFEVSQSEDVGGFRIETHLLIDPNLKLDEKSEIPTKYIFDSEITKHNFRAFYPHINIYDSRAG